MTRAQIVRAWKDVEYRKSLSSAERAKLPEHPCGRIDVRESDLKQKMGGTATLHSAFGFCCY